MSKVAVNSVSVIIKPIEHFLMYSVYRVVVNIAGVVRWNLKQLMVNYGVRNEIRLKNG